MSLAEELRALAAKATSGPWTVGKEIDDEYHHADIDGNEIEEGRAQNSVEITWNCGVPIMFVAEDDRREANAALLVVLRNNLPAIIAALEAQEPRKGERRNAASDTWPVNGEFFRRDKDRRKVAGTKSQRGEESITQMMQRIASASETSAPHRQQIRREMAEHQEASAEVQAKLLSEQSAPSPLADEIIKGGVAFIMGPGGDEGTRMVRNSLADRIDALLFGMPHMVVPERVAPWLRDAVAILREAAKELRK